MNRRQKRKTNTKENTHLNRYYKARVKDIFNQLKKRQLIVQNITFPGGYFMSMTHLKYAIVHFEIKEIPHFKFGIWFENYNPLLFGEHKETIDKFKPSQATFSPCTENLTVTDDLEYIYHHDKVDWDNLYDRIKELETKPWMADWSPNYDDYNENESKLDYQRHDSNYTDEFDQIINFKNELYDNIQQLVKSSNNLEAIVLPLKVNGFTDTYPTLPNTLPIFNNDSNNLTEEIANKLLNIETELKEKYHNLSPFKFDNLDLGYYAYVTVASDKFNNLLSNKSKKKLRKELELSKKDRFLIITALERIIL